MEANRSFAKLAGILPPIETGIIIERDELIVLFDDLDTIEHAHARQYLPCDLCRRAAAGGYLNTLKWAVANGYSIGNGCTFRDAVANGHIDTAMFALECGIILESTLYLSSMNLAAEQGHLEVVMWLQSFGLYPLDMPAACISAAVGGHLAILQYLLDQGHLWEKAVVDAAAEWKHQHIVDWAIENKLPGAESYILDSKKELQ